MLCSTHIFVDRAIAASTRPPPPTPPPNPAAPASSQHPTPKYIKARPRRETNGSSSFCLFVALVPSCVVWGGIDHLARALPLLLYKVFQ